MKNVDEEYTLRATHSPVSTWLWCHFWYNLKLTVRNRNKLQCNDRGNHVH